MPVISTTQQAALCMAVASRFGQPIRYPSHCEALEAAIALAQPQGGRPSANTLRRFFGLVKKTGGYHLHTLDALAHYAGYADFADFTNTTFTASATPGPVADIPELLAMPRLNHAERLLLGYFLGQITRTNDFTPNPLALRLAAHPAGQEYFVESYVDLAHLNGAYGQVVAEYLRHKTTPEAQLYGHSVLLLGEFLAGRTAAWQMRLPLLLALPVPPDTHSFPRGRRAFAEIVAAWHTNPAQPLPAGLWQRLHADSTLISRPSVDASCLPAFYNYFPAGFHFLVAEAFFLTNQYTALGEWITFTLTDFPELHNYEHNVFNELLRAFRAVAAMHAGQPVAWTPTALATVLATHEWLRDYYQIHYLLIELYFATTAPIDSAYRKELQEQIQAFATARRMPFFAETATRIAMLAKPIS